MRLDLRFGALLSASILAAGHVHAQEPKLPATVDADTTFSWDASYTADIISPVDGMEGDARGVFLDDVSLSGALNLERLMGWRGASLTGYVLSNSGGEPNARLGTLEGVSNIEVERARVRLFELYLTQGFGGGFGDVRVGLIDLNARFYATPSSDLLIAPPFGIGSELAATGPAGPSIFPSSALAVEARVAPVEGVYAQVGVFNARAGTVGDPDGVDTEFEDGALLIGELGLTGEEGLLAFGAWAYTEDQDDLRDVRADGSPEPRTSRGAYALVERPLNDLEGPRATTAFFRFGLSEGETTPFRGSAQAGFSTQRVFAGRPDSQFALGVHYARLSDDFVDNAAAAGDDLESSEYGLELTYSDALTPWLTVQPNLQAIANPGGRADADTLIVAGLRIGIAFSGER